MKAWSIVSTMTVALLLIGCATSARSEEPSFRTLAKGAFSGVAVEKKEVIKSIADWEKFWTQHALSTSPVEKRPAVDFRKEMVVAVTMGRQRTGGYAIEIVNVTKTEAQLKIAYTRTKPAAGGITIQVLSAPFHFVAVPRNDLKPVFTEVSVNKEAPAQN